MAEDKPREKELLKDYHGEAQLPDDLYVRDQPCAVICSGSGGSVPVMR
jgi:hypothetical protein